MEQQVWGTGFGGGPETVHGSYLPFGVDGGKEYGNSWPRASLGGDRAFISHQGNLKYPNFQDEKFIFLTFSTKDGFIFQG